MLTIVPAPYRKINSDQFYCIEQMKYFVLYILLSVQVVFLPRPKTAHCTGAFRSWPVIAGARADQQ